MGVLTLEGPTTKATTPTMARRLARLKAMIPKLVTMRRMRERMKELLGTLRFKTRVAVSRLRAEMIWGFLVILLAFL